MIVDSVEMFGAFFLHSALSFKRARQLADDRSRPAYPSICDGICMEI